MKRIVTLIAALAMSVAAWGQSIEEILSKMEVEFNRGKTEGLIMTMDLKIPIIGTISTRTWTLGEKVKAVGTLAGASISTWSDGKTSWTYNSKDNTLEIKDFDPSKKSGGEEDSKMFEGITDGYDVSIKKETDTQWELLCKKSRTNKDKDDPKTMNLVVAKGTFKPISLKAKLSGVTMTMRDIDFGVSESEVTYDPNAFPGAVINDKRGQ